MLDVYKSSSPTLSFLGQEKNAIQIETTPCPNCHSQLVAEINSMKIQAEKKERKENQTAEQDI